MPARRHPRHPHHPHRPHHPHHPHHPPTIPSIQPSGPTLQRPCPLPAPNFSPPASQVQGAAGYPSAAQGTAVFNVGSSSSLSALSTSAGTVPGGGAMVTDPGSPATNYIFAGPGQQSYKREVTCDAGASASGAVTTTATLTASNGQQISQSATVQKQCYDLRVSVASKASPYVGRWGWSVTKSASPTSISLRPDAKAYAGTTTGSFGRDYAATTTADVVYSVTFRRSPPAGAVAGAPAFEASGEVYVQNPAPINARLQGVYISISNARGGAPYVAPATCPVLIIPAGQRITCRWAVPRPPPGPLQGCTVPFFVPLT
jgi:hypothetical protein